MILPEASRAVFVYVSHHVSCCLSVCMSVAVDIPYSVDVIVLINVLLCQCFDWPTGRASGL